MKNKSNIARELLPDDSSQQLLASTSLDLSISAGGDPTKRPAVGVAAPSVFIADASRMACQLMTSALGRSRYRFNVIGYATDRAGVRAGWTSKNADVAVISAHLKDGVFAGLDAVKEMRVSSPGTGVIAILDSITSPIVVETFRAGATGILSREEPFEVLSKCINAVYHGQVWASSKQIRFALDALAQTPSAETYQVKGSKRTSVLTKREESVVRLVAEGLTNYDIAKQLSLSEHTVRNYLFRIFNKVGTSNRLELALYALNRRQDFQL
jgi:DNA-binding NarL/FixJ family response regulator